MSGGTFCGGTVFTMTPALVMERLLTSLHDLLAPETQPPPGAPRPLSFFTISLKCSLLHNVAKAAYYYVGEQYILWIVAISTGAYSSTMFTFYSNIILIVYTYMRLSLDSAITTVSTKFHILSLFLSQQ